MWRDGSYHSRSESISEENRALCREKVVYCGWLPAVGRRGQCVADNSRMRLINPILKRIRDAIRNPRLHSRIHSLDMSRPPALSHSVSREESLSEGLKDMHHALKLQRRPEGHTLFQRHRQKAKSTFRIEVRLKPLKTDETAPGGRERKFVSKEVYASFD